MKTFLLTMMVSFSAFAARRHLSPARSLAAHRDCVKLSDASMKDIAARCPELQTLNVM